MARLLVRAEPASVQARSEALGGRTPLQAARDADLAGLARRLDEYARECESESESAATSTAQPTPVTD